MFVLGEFRGKIRNLPSYIRIIFISYFFLIFNNKPIIFNFLVAGIEIVYVWLWKGGFHFVLFYYSCS